MKISILLFFVLIGVETIAQESKTFYLTADRVFDGEVIHEGWAVVVEKDKIISVGPKEKIKEPTGAIKINYPNSTLLPGLIEGHSHLLLYPYNITDWDTQVLKESDSYRTARATIHAKNTLMAGFTTARDQLNGLRKDPQRKVIVIDPRRTETADAADLHIALRPGTDAFLLGALLAELQRRNAFDERFLAERVVGVDEVKAALGQVPVGEWLAAADVASADFERLVQLVVGARAMVVRVELGIQQGLNSTLNSYL